MSALPWKADIETGQLGDFAAIRRARHVCAIGRIVNLSPSS